MASGLMFRKKEATEWHLIDLETGDPRIANRWSVGRTTGGSSGSGKVFYSPTLSGWMGWGKRAWGIGKSSSLGTSQTDPPGPSGQGHTMRKSSWRGVKTSRIRDWKNRNEEKRKCRAKQGRGIERGTLYENHKHGSLWSCKKFLTFCLF